MAMVVGGLILAAVLALRSRGVRDFNVLLDGAAHIHQVGEPPKIGQRIRVNGGEAEIYDIAENDERVPVDMAQRVGSES